MSEPDILTTDATSQTLSMDAKMDTTRLTDATFWDDDWKTKNATGIKEPTGIHITAAGGFS